MANNFELLSEKIADEDLFWPGLKSFVTNLKEFIDLIPNDSPILISGDWGSGKSSAITALQKKLEGEQKKIVKGTNMQTINATTKTEKVARKVVIFEAWRYEQENSLLSCLIRDVWEKGSLNEEEKKAVKNFLGTAIKATAAITVRSIPAIMQFFPGGEIAKQVLKGLSIDNIKKDLEAIDFKEDPETNYTDELHKSFKEIVDKCYKEYDELVVIIDDLDRCSPESAIHLLESMRILINNSQQGIKEETKDKVDVRFIVAMDKVTLSEAIENKFSELTSYDANRYLEKLFPYMFNLPRIAINEVEEFILQLVKGGRKPLYTPGELAENSHFDISNIERFIKTLNFAEFLNPRLIKRCINRYAICLKVARKDPQFISINNVIVLWIAATERWPLLKRLINVKPPAYWITLKAAVENDTSLEDSDGQRFLEQREVV